MIDQKKIFTCTGTPFISEIGKIKAPKYIMSENEKLLYEKI